MIQKIIQKTKELLKLEEQANPVPKPPEPKPQPKPRPKPAPKPKPPTPGPTNLEGVDYSYGNGVTAQEIKNAGKHFVVRYISGGNSKDIDKKELWNLLNVGLKVCLVWETTGETPREGKLAGIADAHGAKKQCEELGIGQALVYFAADFDATEADQGKINAYLTGATQVLGTRRVGLYAGYWAIKRAFDANKIKYGWQTYAWSGGKWDPRAQLQQYDNGAKLGPAEVDLDRSTKSDYGQWPRP